MKRQYTLEINNAFPIFLNTKAQYINILKQLRESEHKGYINHYCSNAFDFGNWIVIRSVFKVSNRLTKEKISIKVGFRECVEKKR